MPSPKSPSSPMSHTSPPASGDPPPRTKVSLTSTQETLMATLWARHWDNIHGDPKRGGSIFGDRWASYTVERIDYDWSRMDMSRLFYYMVAMRGRRFDDVTLSFLERHKDTGVTVIHMACGLDGRVNRMQDHYGGALPPRTRWIDVDLPDVVPLRDQLLPKPKLAEGDKESSYTLTSASVLDQAWQSSLPTDRPTLLIMEGLSVYLEPAAGKKLIRDLTERFRHCPVGGELVLDCAGSSAMRFSRFYQILRVTGANFRWAINSPSDVGNCHPSLRLAEDATYRDLTGLEKMDWLTRFFIRLTSIFMPRAGRILRFRFGGEDEGGIGASRPQTAASQAARKKNDD